MESRDRNGLPVAPLNQSTVTDDSAHLYGARMATCNPCIAVVDDEAFVRTALARLLRLAGYETVTYASGEDFLAALEDPRPDCVLLDIHLPGLSGFDVKDRLTILQFNLPVIFITASDETDCAQAARVGSYLLHKPFSNDKLLATIAAALGPKAIAK
jgi:FixJ family two-component response regulator